MQLLSHNRALEQFHIPRLSQDQGRARSVTNNKKYPQGKTSVMSSGSDSITARLEEMGANQVRTLMTSGNLPGAWNVGFVTKWLASKDQEERQLFASAQAEQIEIARVASSAAERSAAAAERASISAERQAIAAERANTRATVALTIAIISIVATVAGMIIVHFDTIRQIAHPG